MSSNTNRVLKKLAPEERQKFLIKKLQKVSQEVDRTRGQNEAFQAVLETNAKLQAQFDALQVKLMRLEGQFAAIMEHLSKRSTDLDALQNLAADVGHDKRQ